MFQEARRQHREYRSLSSYREEDSRDLLTDSRIWYTRAYIGYRYTEYRDFFVPLARSSVQKALGRGEADYAIICFLIHADVYSL